jgi:hypothetical protein
MEAVKQSINNNIPNLNTGTIQENLGNVVTGVGQTITGLKDAVNESINKFSSPTNVNATGDFLNTNTIIAKVVFILFVIILFVILLNIGVAIIIYFTSASNTPYIIKGLLTNGNSNKVITQDPRSSKNTSVNIKRSNNAESGLECTWSLWVYVYDVDILNQIKFKHIFNKGNTEFDTDGVATVNNAPGLYVSNTNGVNMQFIRVYMDSMGDSKQNRTYIDISGIPLRKWFNICIRIQNNVMDVYINGTISGRTKFSYVPKQNYDNINIGHNGGFNGQLSNFIYYDYALSAFEMNNIILQGPNLVVFDGGQGGSNYNYISNMWYSSKY